MLSSQMATSATQTLMSINLVRQNLASMAGTYDYYIDILLLKYLFPNFPISEDHLHELNILSLMKGNHINEVAENIIRETISKLGYTKEQLQRMHGDLRGWSAKTWPYLTGYQSLLDGPLLKNDRPWFNQVVEWMDVQFGLKAKLSALMPMVDLPKKDNVVEVIAQSLPKSSQPVSATLAATTFNYLSDNKYKLLFIAALTGYGIYDHYHENHIGKTAESIKNSIFSMWHKGAGPSIKQETNQDKNQVRDSDLQIRGPSLYKST